MAISIILVSFGGQINKENYDRISNGMSKSQVEKILGEVAGKSESGL